MATRSGRSESDMDRKSTVWRAPKGFVLGLAGDPPADAFELGVGCHARGPEDAEVGQQVGGRDRGYGRRLGRGGCGLRGSRGGGCRWGGGGRRRVRHRRGRAAHHPASFYFSDGAVNGVPDGVQEASFDRLPGGAVPPPIPVITYGAVLRVRGWQIGDPEIRPVRKTNISARRRS